jgi:hypothetical protein
MNPSPDKAALGGDLEASAETFSFAVKLAAKLGYIDSDQMKEALGWIGNGGGSELTVDRLVEAGWLDQAQRDYLAAADRFRRFRRSEKPALEASSARGLATDPDVNEALTEQTRVFKSSRRIVSALDLLVRDRRLSPEDRDAIRAEFGSPEAEAAPAAQRPASAARFGPDPSELDLSVTPDELTAHVRVRPKSGARLTVDLVLAKLTQASVTAGVLSSDRLRMEIDAAGDDGWIIAAEGLAPTPPTPPRTEYSFQTDPLKIGRLKKGGHIDFRDRGELPQVNEGDVLAVRTPPTEGQPGWTVYGSPLAPPHKPINPPLLCGPGAKRSDDGLTVYATRAGRPAIAADGKIMVLDQHLIDGDVDFETGHVRFDGQVEVRGAVKDGFQVKAGGLIAEDILKAEIDVLGDVVAHQGIVGAKIKAGGNVRARFVRKSEIEAAGNVVVESEIHHAQIETGGQCWCERGKIVDSWVVAAGGIMADEIGSRSARAGAVTIGVDPLIHRQIERLKDEIAREKKALDKIQPVLEDVRENQQRMEDKMLKPKQNLALAVKQRQMVQEKLDASTDDLDGKQRAKAEAAIRYLDGTIEKLEADLERMMASYREVEELAAARQAEADEIDGRIKAHKEEIEALRDISQNRGPASLSVTGSILAGTTVKGAHSARVLDEDMTFVRFQEALVDGEDGPVHTIVDARLK